MTLTMQAARQRVNVRLDRLVTGHAIRESDQTAALESLALLCVGTDVRGPELEDELKSTIKDALLLLESMECECEGSEPPVFNCASPTVLAGVLLRTFWLGYEYGVES